MYKKRKELEKKLISTFSREKEIYAIYFFGKQARGKEDQYSDFDMIICSNDIRETQKKYYQLFNDISPIIGTWIIDTRKDNFSEMIMLKDYSPYQKIDLTITPNINKRQIFAPFIKIYDAENYNEINKTEFEIIDFNKDKNQLNDYLFSAPRFTKCLHRKNIDAYRRWKGMTDVTLVLLYKKYFGWNKNIENEKKSRLTAKETDVLYQTINKNDQDRLNSIFPKDFNLDLSESYKNTWLFLIELMEYKLKDSKITFDNNFNNHMKEFLMQEIKNYKKNKTL